MFNLHTNRSTHPLQHSDVRSSRLLRPTALFVVGVSVAMACSGGCPSGAPDGAPGFLGDLTDGGPTPGNSGTADAGNGSGPGTVGDTQGNGLHVPDQQVFAMQGDSVEITLRLEGGADPDSDVRYVVVVAPAFGIITAGETREINTATLIYTPPADFAGNTAISYVARTNSGESNVGTVSITVYAEVRFGVETLDERGLSVRCFAATVGGDPLPDGTYVWRFDDVEDSGLMSTHTERTHTFADAGIHTISLTIILAGLQGPIACRSIDDSELQIRKHVTPRVSGRVRLSDGQPLAGVSVRASDGSLGDTTDEQGRYSFDVPLYWSGQVRAFRAGYSFTPAFIEIGDVARDVHNAHFTASADTGSKAPVAYTQAVRTLRDTDVLITLTGSDPENDPLTYIVATLPAHGALFDAQRGYRIASGDLPYALAANLATYSPAAGYAGADAFRFRVSDGPNQSPDADIKIDVGQSNQAPVAHSQDVRTLRDTDLLITLTGSDPENDPLTYIVATLPAHGALFDAQRGYRIASGDLPYALAANLATYSPAAGYSGADAFRFRVSDGPNQSPDADIKIGVGQPNRAPLAHSQDVRVAEDRDVLVKLTGSDPDNDPLTFIIVALPTHGLLDDPQSGRGIGAGDLPYLLFAASVRYTPQANYAGGDRFSFKVNDGQDDSAAGDVNLSVDGENDAPMIEQRNPFILTVNKDSKRTDPFNQFQLSATDVDAAPNSLIWKILIAPAHGSAWLDGGSPSSSGQAVQFSYEPAPAYGGRDGFTVEVSDAEGLNSAIQVQVAIGGYLLSGVVSDYNGNPSYGVPVEALDDNNNPWQTRVSDSNGLYEFLVPPGWSGTLTSDANYRFEPASKGYNNVSASSAQDFTAFRNYYVATTGDDGSSGLIDAEFATIQRAANVVGPGDTVLIKDGTYHAPSSDFYTPVLHIVTSGSANSPIRFENYRDDVVILDGESVLSPTPNGHARGLLIDAGIDYIRLTGLVIKDVYTFGADIRGDWCVVEDCIFEACGLNQDSSGESSSLRFYYCQHAVGRRCLFRNGNTGGSAVMSVNVLFEDCLSYGHSTYPGNADGFMSKKTENGNQRLTFRRCIAYGNTDDGFDLTSMHDGLVEDCIAFNQVGVDAPGGAAGNGFKVRRQASGTLLRNCIAFNNTPGFGIATGDSSTVNCSFLNNTSVYNVAAGFSFGGTGTTAIGNVSQLTFYHDLKSGSCVNCEQDFNDYADGTRMASPLDDNSLSADPIFRDANPQIDTSWQGGFAIYDVRGIMPTLQHIRTQIEVAFALQSVAAGDPENSPCIDAGTFTTFTSQAQVSTTEIPVRHDPRLRFRTGDLIQVEDSGVATLVAMTASTLTVDAPLTFDADKGVHWRPWNGDRPDIGAYESQ